MKKKILCILLSFLLEGCVTFRNNDLPSIDELPFSKIDKTISINVFPECYTRGGYSTTCTDYKEDLLETMNKSKLFKSVGVNKFYADYNVDIKYIYDKNYSLFMSIITFIPSLGLIPKFQTDYIYITLDISNIKTSKHQKLLLKEKMFTVKETLLFPFMTKANPVQEFMKLKEDILNNITVEIYDAIKDLEHY